MLAFYENQGRRQIAFFMLVSINTMSPDGTSHIQGRIDSLVLGQGHGYRCRYVCTRLSVFWANPDGRIRCVIGMGIGSLIRCHFGISFDNVVMC